VPKICKYHIDPNTRQPCTQHNPLPLTIFGFQEKNMFKFVRDYKATPSFADDKLEILILYLSKYGTAFPSMLGRYSILEDTPTSISRVEECAPNL
jgi:hypothetical protein